MWWKFCNVECFKNVKINTLIQVYQIKNTTIDLSLLIYLLSDLKIQLYIKFIMFLYKGDKSNQ